MLARKESGYRDDEVLVKGRSVRGWEGCSEKAASGLKGIMSFASHHGTKKEKQCELKFSGNIQC